MIKKPIHTTCIIDDDSAYVYLTQRIIMMKRLCQNLLIYENGRIAMNGLLGILENDEDFPDLILLDINMPEMDGWQFLQEFTKLKPRLPKPVTIYLVTSSVDVRDVERARKFSDVSSYIIKPIDYPTLAELFGVDPEGPTP